MPNEIASKRCCKCKKSKPLSEFYKNCTTKDGYQLECKTCRKEHAQSKRSKTYHKIYQNQYYQTEKGKAVILKSVKKYQKTIKGKISKQKAQKRFYARHPERQKAINTVSYAIQIGKLSHIDTLQCHYCPMQAEQYHHHKGYEPKHWLDVLPTCKRCHRKIHKEISRINSLNLSLVLPHPGISSANNQP